MNRLSIVNPVQILVLHGPNLNLLGLRSSRRGEKVTLDKVDRSLRQSVSSDQVKLRIFQTHDESHAVTLVQRNRNRVSGILFNPGPWHLGGHVLADTLELVRLPLVIVNINPSPSSIFSPDEVIEGNDPIQAYLLGLQHLLGLTGAENSIT